MPSSELSGGARLHFIFQNLFVKSLDDVDPCDDLADEDIKTAIQNATGAKNTIFVPEVPFEVLVRRQIARLLDPSLQCARFVYNELVKVSHQCESYELQRFPILRKRVEEVVANFLRDGLIPAETMICHLIEMEMDYINTSHPSFIGGSKAVELVLQQHRIARQSTIVKDANELKDPLTERVALSMPPEKMAKTRVILGRPTTPDHGNKSSNARSDSSAASFPGGNWGISSIFAGDEILVHSNGKDATFLKHYTELDSSVESSFATIQLKEPPATLQASHAWSEQDYVEIAITRLLIKSYYDIVRKNIQDLVPKAIMHFLVNHTKRDLHNVFIRKLYRENLFEEMLQEREEVVLKRKRCKEVLCVLQQAAHTLEELPLDHESFPGQPISTLDRTGLPHPLSIGYGLGSQIPSAAYTNTPKSSKVRKSFFSEELLLPNGLIEGTGIPYPSIYS